MGVRPVFDCADGKVAGGVDTSVGLAPRDVVIVILVYVLGDGAVGVFASCACVGGACARVLGRDAAGHQAGARLGWGLRVDASCWGFDGSVVLSFW